MVHDEEGEVPDVAQLRVQVVSSEQAVRHWESELALAVKDAQALDGVLLSAWTTLIGDRDRRIDEAMARVEEHRRRIGVARLAVDEAKAALAWAEEQATSRASAARDRVAAFERVAERLRGADGPEADELRAFESRLRELGSRMEGLTRALGSLSGARAAANKVIRACDASVQGKQRDLVGAPFGGMQSAHALSQVHAAIAAWEERVPALEAALAAAGLDYRATTDTDAPSMWGELLNDSFWANLRSLDRLSELRARFDQVHHELALVLDPVERERRELQQQVGEVEQRRAALLERLS